MARRQRSDKNMAVGNKGLSWEDRSPPNKGGPLSREVALGRPNMRVRGKRRGDDMSWRRGRFKVP